MKAKKIIILFIVLALNAHYAGAKEITSARMLLIAPGGRPNAMGEAFTAVADDNNALYWNPAGIATLSQREVSFTHLKGLISTNIEFLTYVHPVKSLKGALGGSISYLSDTQWRVDEAGNFTGEFDNDALTTILSYARKITASFSSGINIKYLRWTLDNHTANGTAADVGFLYREVLPEFSIGLTVQNIGPTMKFIRDKFSLPLMINTGLGYTLLAGKLTLAFDVNHYAIDKETGFSAGGEYIIKEMFSYRMGYKYHPDDVKSKRIGGLSTGIGFGVDGYGLDYAFVPYGELGDMHKISFTVKF